MINNIYLQRHPLSGAHSPLCGRWVGESQPYSEQLPPHRQPHGEGGTGELELPTNRFAALLLEYSCRLLLLLFLTQNTPPPNSVRSYVW